MSEILVSKGIREELDLRNLVVIAETIRAYEEEENFDKFQIFDIKDSSIINKQEIPEREKKINLSYTNNKSETVWAIKGIDPIVGEHWTILYPSEY